jgi:hypothetical protein
MVDGDEGCGYGKGTTSDDDNLRFGCIILITEFNLEIRFLLTFLSDRWVLILSSLILTRRRDSIGAHYFDKREINDVEVIDDDPIHLVCRMG